MPQSWVFEHPIGALSLSVQQLGAHLVVCVSGGDAPHIGSVVLAEPRASLSGVGTSATSSVLNRICHKDEAVARGVAETLAARLDTVVCCVCGIHKNDATADDIAACANLDAQLSAFLLEHVATDVAENLSTD